MHSLVIAYRIYIPEIHGFASGYTQWLCIFRKAIKTGQPPVPLDEYLEVAAALHMGRISADEHRVVERKEI